MKKWLNLALLIAFLLCYTEWGKGQSMFIGGALIQLLVVKPKAENFLHPVILSGLAGILLFLYCAFSKRSTKWLNHLAVLSCGLVVLLFLVVGIAARNPKIIASTLPFLVLALVYLFRNPYRKSHLLS